MGFSKGFVPSSPGPEVYAPPLPPDLAFYIPARSTLEVLLFDGLSTTHSHAVVQLIDSPSFLGTHCYNNRIIMP